MMAAVRSATLLGVDGAAITVEVHVSNGLPAYQIVGLPDTTVRESRERVRAALLSSDLQWPLRRLTVNLAPGNLRKTGAGLELAVALGLLQAGGELPEGALDNVGVLGELGLDGSVRTVPGVLALVDTLRRVGCHTVIVPIADAVEAALVDGIVVRAARTLGELRACLKGEAEWPSPEPGVVEELASSDDAMELDDVGDLSDVRGLHSARRALEVAAAGAHHLLMVGPPGTGKTMLARRLPTILPPLEPDEALVVTRIHSAAGRGARRGLLRARPFRAPHHTISAAALVGGGSARPSPGAVTLAHLGCLFLDELAEFPPHALDALRQPLEDGVVRIARQRLALTFPARFQLLACSNPCPCGLGVPRCMCSDVQRARYRRRLSGPLLDRFDLRLTITPPEHGEPPGTSSAEARARVEAAVAHQARRYLGRGWQRNAHVPASALDSLLPLGIDAGAAWREVVERERFTGRGAASIRRVARTLADLDGTETILAVHVLEAAEYRQEIL